MSARLEILRGYFVEIDTAPHLMATGPAFLVTTPRGAKGWAWAANDDAEALDVRVPFGCLRRGLYPVPAALASVLADNITAAYWEEDGLCPLCGGFVAADDTVRDPKTGALDGCLQCRLDADEAAGR